MIKNKSISSKVKISKVILILPWFAFLFLFLQLSMNLAFLSAFLSWAFSGCPQKGQSSFYVHCGSTYAFPLSVQKRWRTMSTFQGTETKSQSSFLSWPRIICLDTGYCSYTAGGLLNGFSHNDPQETNQVCVSNLYHTLSNTKICITLAQLHLECQSLSFPSLALSVHSLGLHFIFICLDKSLCLKFWKTHGKLFLNAMNTT